MKLLPVEWSESFATSVAIALGSDTRLIYEQVKSGACQCWIFTCDGQTIGHAVTRLETDTLCVVAYEGLNVQAFADYIIRVAVAKNLPYARFHTHRPGLIKLLAEFKPEPLEYVMRIKCYGR